MSRSYKAPRAVDSGKGRKQQAAQSHRAAENRRLEADMDDYQPLPSKHYTNPYDISDFSFILKRIWEDQAWFVKGKNKINK